ncbi:hypothetical protein [Paenibacillus qinlingensis]|uniref:hypothetical protein n=1 Tax=Paenibacillus qinlingensis TaxID=1837343 RepID=UPI001FE7B963|nr:hypothetical protein [Paenibacillus qinlingensis]
MMKASTTASSPASAFKIATSRSSSGWFGEGSFGAAGSADSGFAPRAAARAARASAAAWALAAFSSSEPASADAGVAVVAGADSPASAAARAARRAALAAARSAAASVVAGVLAPATTDAALLSEPPSGLACTASFLLSTGGLSALPSSFPSSLTGGVGTVVSSGLFSSLIG